MKHPLHPMLVGLPIGLWVFALVCDVVYQINGNAVWQTVATYCVAGGIAGAILAAVPGLIDYFSIGEAQMKRIANLHLAVNMGAFAPPNCSSSMLPNRGSGVPTFTVYINFFMWWYIVLPFKCW